MKNKAKPIEKKKKEKNDPWDAVIKQLDEYEEGTPKRTNIMGTWGE